MRIEIDYISPNGCGNYSDYQTKAFGLGGVVRTLVHYHYFKEQLRYQERYDGVNLTNTIGDCINQINVTVGNAHYIVWITNAGDVLNNTIVVDTINKTPASKWHLKELKRVARIKACNFVNI